MEIVHMSKIGKLIRWKEWKTSKLPLVFLFSYYILFVKRAFTFDILLTFFNFVGFMVFYASFGYMINDFSDIEIDKKAGKQKIIAQMKPIWVKMLLVCIALIGFLMTIPFWDNFIIPIIVVIMYFFCAFYSLPPLRFKEKGWFGLIVASITQRTFPALLCSIIFGYFDWIIFLLLILYLIIGIRKIIVHQLKDYENDLKGKVQTYITSKRLLSGYQLLFKVIIPIEIGLLVVILILFSIEIPMILVLIFIYLVTSYFSGFRLTKECLMNSVLIEESFMHSFYSFYLPIFFTFLLSSLSPWFFLIVTFHLIWVYNIIKSEINRLFRPKIIFFESNLKDLRRKEKKDNFQHYYFDKFFSFEKWNFIAKFNKNSYIIATFSIRGNQCIPETIKGKIEANIYFNGKNKISINSYFTSKEITFSSHEIIFGANKIEIKNSDIGLILKLENSIIKLYLKQDNNSLLWGKEGKINKFTTGGNRFLGWSVPSPCTEVKGVLNSNKDLPGMGYFDHFWGNISLKNNIHCWHWGKLYSEDISLIFLNIIFTNKAKFFLFALFEKNKVIYLKSKRLDKNPINLFKFKHNVSFPTSFRLKYNQENVLIDLKFNVEDKIKSRQKQPLRLKQPLHIHFLSKADGKIILNNNELLNENKNQVIHELYIF